MKSLLILAALLAAVPDAQSDIKADLTRAGANSNSYEFPEIRDSRAPRGYKPFYISHYGRHGSRSNWGGRTYRLVIDELSAAGEAGLLTEAGEKTLAEAQAVYEAWGGMDGRLSQRGAREHAKIAGRLYHRYPRVFRRGSRKIRSVASVVPRCLISMNAFTQSLTKIDPKLCFTFDTGEKLMEYISNTGNDESWEQMEGVWTKMQEIYALPYDTVAVMPLLFTDTAAARQFVPDCGALENAMYDVASIAEDWDIEEDIYPLLPFDLVWKRYSATNHDLYFNHCNSLEYGDIRVPFAKSLSDDIIAKADEAIAGGEYCADLRFGHDHPLLGLLSYMGVEGVGERLSWDEVDAKWFGYKYIPMASNLQFIFYRNRAGKVLVKILYQEQETLLKGLEPDVAPCFYEWGNLKEHFSVYSR